MQHRTALALVAALFLTAPQAWTQDVRLELADGWAIESSAKVTAAGEALSQPGASTSGWHRASVPTTVVSALVADGTYPDPYVGTNLRTIPGTSYPVGHNFSNLDMPADSPFGVPWWFRTEVTLPATAVSRVLWLRLDGVNYRFDAWLNGKRIAAAADTAGAFRVHEIDVTGVAKSGKNALAVLVYPPRASDLAITFVDWNPMPPDKVMGLWRPVALVPSGPIALRHPQVVTKVPALDRAELTVKVFAVNATAAPVRATVSGRIGPIAFGKPVDLAARESREVVFTPAEFPALVVRDPKLWWPVGLRRARAPRPRADGERRRRGQRPRVEPLRHPGVHRGRRRRRPPPLQGERPQHPRPWRGLDVRHDAPHVARAAGGRGPLRQGHGPQHHPPRGQARGRALLRPDGPRGPARHARLVLLRHVGEVGQVDGRAAAGRGRLPPRPDPPPARPRLRLHVAQRQRRSAAGERREGVPRRAPRARLPEPGGVVGDGKEGGALGSERDEDARAVRVGAARLLVHGHQARRPARLRHRDRPGAGAAPAREPAPLHSREGPLADQRHVDLSLRRWSLQGPEGLQRRDGRPLRPVVQRRGVRAQGAGRRLRVAPRDARELRRPQVRLDRDHPVDAQQRVARA